MPIPTPFPSPTPDHIVSADPNGISIWMVLWTIFSAVANLASIGGLYYSKLSLKNIKDLKQQYTHMGKFANRLERIRYLSVNLELGYKNYVRSVDDISKCLNLMEVNVSRMRDLLSDEGQNYVDELLALITTYYQDPNKENVWVIFVKVQRIIEESDGVAKDQPWN